MAWMEIAEFPGYSVSSEGRVMNNNTGRVLALQMNQHGVVNAGLMKNGIQHKRSVALLVATAFLPPASSKAFNTPINLDGDKTNNAVENLMWRPRWFAREYHRQFPIRKPALRSTLRDTKTGEVYENSADAAVRNGLLDKEVFTSTINRTFAWPTYQLFQVIS